MAIKSHTIMHGKRCFFIDAFCVAHERPSKMFSIIGRHFHKNLNAIDLQQKV
jgi:hypothetical protein